MPTLTYATIANGALRLAPNTPYSSEYKCEEAIEIHTHLQAASPFLAVRLTEKIQNYPVSSSIAPQTP